MKCFKKFLNLKRVIFNPLNAISCVCKRCEPVFARFSANHCARRTARRACSLSAQKETRCEKASGAPCLRPSKMVIARRNRTRIIKAFRGNRISFDFARKGKPPRMVRWFVRIQHIIPKTFLSGSHFAEALPRYDFIFSIRRVWIFH